MKSSTKRTDRIGIYAGTFDPVHVGHITFALQAMEAASLDEVVFLPERSPRRKHPSEHYAHRVAMLKRAIRPHPNMSVMELVDKHFTIKRTWPELQRILPGAELAMLVGSDVLAHMSDWPNLGIILRDSELIVGARAEDEPAMIRTVINAWPYQPQGLHIIKSYAPHVSSTNVRGALATSSHANGLLASVRSYAKANWLYVSIEHAINKTHH